MSQDVNNCKIMLSWLTPSLSCSFFCVYHCSFLQYQMLELLGFDVNSIRSVVAFAIPLKSEHNCLTLEACMAQHAIFVMYISTRATACVDMQCIYPMLQKNKTLWRKLTLDSRPTFHQSSRNIVAKWLHVQTPQLR